MFTLHWINLFTGGWFLIQWTSISAFEGILHQRHNFHQITVLTLFRVKDLPPCQGYMVLEIPIKMTDTGALIVLIRKIKQVIAKIYSFLPCKIKFPKHHTGELISNASESHAWISYYDLNNILKFQYHSTGWKKKCSIFYMIRSVLLSQLSHWPPPQLI